MKVATLSIGDELICGETVDTNASVIAGSLYRHGIKVRRHQTVGDDEPDIMAMVDSLSAAFDAVIVTGGLGPTTDDVTSRAVARATGRRLVLNEEALDRMRQFFRERGQDMHPTNEKQALLPARCTLIPNPLGTASGFGVTHNGCFMFFLPGVPMEMGRMLEETVVPFLESRREEQTVIQTKVLKVFGLSEAEIGARLQGVSRPGVTTAFCVDFPQVLVTFRGEGTDGKELSARVAQLGAEARKKLGEHVFAEDEETMDSVIASLFKASGLTLSLAESCTGGLVAARITDIPGSSAYFLEGAVTYSNGAKTRALKVSRQLLDERGAVSSETATAMARGVRQLTGSDVALAITGIAGPEGGSTDKPVGTVYIALADRSGCRAKRCNFHGDRGRIRSATTFAALDLLRRQLLSLAVS